MRRPVLLIAAAATLASGCVPRAVPGKAVSTEGSPPPVAPFSPGRAEPARKANLVAVAHRLDEHFRKIVAETGATASVVGVVLGGELVYGRGFGVRDVGSNVPVDIDTVFRIASMTKSFTAAAVLKLRDEGKVILDAPASAYLPELAVVVGPTRDAPAMTVRDLLTMSSGLPYDDYWGAVTFGFDDDQLARFIRSGITLANSPGRRYAYSNLGYAFLGKIVARVSRTRFRDYVTASILRPLDMSATVWEANDVPLARLAVGYRREQDKLVAEPRPSDGVFDAAGGLYTTMRDYARYVAFQLAAYPPRDDPEAGPLRRSTVREMHAGERWIRWGDTLRKPVAGRSADGGVWLSAANYGFGWVNNTTCAYEGIVQHGGFEPGYISTIHMLPKAGLGIAVLSTSGPVGWRAIDGTLAILRDAGLLEPLSVPAVAPGLVAARDAVGRLLETWDAVLVQTAFDRQSLGYSWLASLREDVAKLARAHGRCRPEGDIEPYNGSQGSWRLHCERGQIEFTATLAPGAPSRLQSLNWNEELAPDERLQGVAKRIVAAMGRLDGETTKDLFDAGMDLANTRKSLARLAIDHGACEIERPISSDGHGWATFRLRCADAPVELSFGIDEKSGRVTRVSGAPPRDPGATCVP